MIPILQLTQSEYAEAIRNRLGKGELHAKICYREWFRQGAITGADPAFNNCPQLLEAIKEVTDTSLPGLNHSVQEGETVKFLLDVGNQLEVESVSIPMQAGGTLCLSSQVGCRLGCRFCETGRMGLLKNLSAAQIVAQVWLAKHKFGASVRNVVFMGMGEPFDNFDSVAQAIRVLKDPGGFGFGRQHITVSTSGLVEGIYRLMDAPDLAVNLAVSLNGSNEALRSSLMPINNRHSMDELKEAMRVYNLRTGKQILTAYVLIGRVNDTAECAHELIEFLAGLDVKINLIPYNPQSKHEMQPPTQESVEAFAKILRDEGLQTLLRQTKGQNIMAACGQLGNRELRKRRVS